MTCMTQSGVLTFKTLRRGRRLIASSVTMREPGIVTEDVIEPGSVV